MRLLQLLIILVVIAAGAVYFNYGTIEPCGVMREQIRRDAARHGGDFGGFVASVMPDSVINSMVAAQYDRPVTPYLCLKIATGIERPPEIKRQ